MSAAYTPHQDLSEPEPQLVLWNQTFPSTKASPQRFRISTAPSLCQSLPSDALMVVAAHALVG